MEAIRGFRAESFRPRRWGATATVVVALTGSSLGPAEAVEPARPATAPAPEEPAGALTLEQAIGLALSRSPDLAAAESEIAAREGERVQAGLLPNPSGELAVEDVAGSGAFRGAGEAETTLRLGQKLELGGKRGARTEAAARSRDAASVEAKVRRAELRAELSERFVDVLARQQEVELRRETREIAEAALPIVQRRIAAGKASPLEGKKAAVALARSRIAEERAARDLQVIRQRLAASWGASAPRFTRAEGDLFARRALPSFELLAELLERSPEIELRAAEIRQRSAEVSLAETGRVPDVTVEGGVRRLEGRGEHALVAGVSLPLPVFDRSQGTIAAARARLLQAEEKGRATQIRLRAELFGLEQDLRRSASELDGLEREILTEAREALELSRAGFEAGRFSLLDLLDAQRTFLEVREERLRAAIAYQTAAARIERIIGGGGL